MKNITIMGKTKKDYLAPMIDVLVIKSEQGFASSGSYNDSSKLDFV